MAMGFWLARDFAPAIDVSTFNGSEAGIIGGRSVY
jgi:hypothetical protein